MNSMSLVIVDSITMLRRVLVHMLRTPAATLMSTLATPMILLLLMYNVFGGAVQQAGTMGSTTSYIDYLTPGLLLITAIYGMGMATMRANADMTQGIIARFRTMSISRGSVLNGHVIGSTLGALFSISVITILAYLTGFRPTVNVGQLLAALALVVLFVLAVTSLAVAIGIASKSPEAANSTLFLPLVLPFISSAFIPTSSMTPVVAWIAENQPFSPVVDTLRGLLMGTPTGNRAILAIAWCIGIGLAGYLWSRAAYNRNAN